MTPLFENENERVCAEAWMPELPIPIGTVGGAEIFVLSGSFTEGDEEFGRHSWLRLPPGWLAKLRSGPAGARIWIKQGHLRFVRHPPATDNRAKSR